MNTLKLLSVTAVVLVALASTGIWYATRPEPPLNPLLANGEMRFTLMDFTTPFSLDALPAGWTHRKFWTRPAMQVTFVTKDGVPALRCETDAGGSILGRWTDIDLGSYLTLSWQWYVESPIASSIDERTTAGDDHPVRWYLAFTDSDGQAHHAEIIWGNRLLRRGDWKVLGSFVHYVADGGDANVGRWREETVDLLSIYRKATGRNDTPHLTELAIFCDSDDTKGHTVAYVGGPVIISK